MRELVSARGNDSLHQTTQVIAILAKVRSESRKEFRMGGRIGRTKIIYRFDNAASEEITPIRLTLASAKYGFSVIQRASSCRDCFPAKIAEENYPATQA